MTDAYCLEQISFAYQRGPCVLSIDKLHLAAGKIHVLVGPNGSGKTTLLHLLAFLIMPTRGQMRFFGQEVRAGDHPKLRRRIGLLLQKPYLFNNTVLENVTCGLKLRGIKKPARQRLALDYLDRIGIAHLASRYPRSLSGGETQCTALAQTLILEPEVLLLDEAFNHLDQASLSATINLIQSIHQERKVTVVLTTHDPSQGQTLADQVYSLCNGHLLSALRDNHCEKEVKKKSGYFCCTQLL
jgi:ABC-type multidrug transport system ATPase subunit